jgi:hypothetical protein
LDCRDRPIFETVDDPVVVSLVLQWNVGWLRVALHLIEAEAVAQTDVFSVFKQ